MRTRRLALVALLGLAVVAHAHETWLVPSTFVAKVGETLRIDLTSGMAFPRLESPIAADRVASATCRLGKNPVEVRSLEAAETSLVLRHTFSHNGVASIWVDLKPRNIELDDGEVAEYLDEVDASAEVRRLWAEQKGKVGWKETYTKHAKTFVAVGDIGGDSSWKVPAGTTLELVPESDPFRIAVGDDIVIRIQ